MSNQSRILFHTMEISRTRECAKKSGNGKSREPLKSFGNLLALAIVCALFKKVSADDHTLTEDDQEAVIDALQEKLEAAGVLKADKEIGETHVIWDDNAKDFDLAFGPEWNNDILEDDWMTTLETKDESTHGIIEDDNLTADEAETLGAFDFWTWKIALIVIGVGLILAAAGAGYYCYSNRSRQSSNTDDTDFASDAADSGDGSSVSAFDYSGYRRRLLHAALSKESGMPAIPRSPLTGKPHAINRPLQNPWGLPGLNDHNIWWIIPLSCMTQLFWIYVVYRMYKACKSRSEDQSPHHELREITIRR